MAAAPRRRVRLVINAFTSQAYCMRSELEEDLWVLSRKKQDFLSARCLLYIQVRGNRWAKTGSLSDYVRL